MTKDSHESKEQSPHGTHGTHGTGTSAFYKHVVAGASAGLCEVLIMYPLDVVKTRLQLQKGNTKYTSVTRTFKVISQEEGIFAFYRGIISPILAEAPKRAIKFASNEMYKPLVANSKGKISHQGAAAAGSLAGMTEALVNTPFEVVKVRMQALENKALYSGTFDAVMKIATKEGPLVLYRGFEAQVLRNGIWNGAYFGTINILKENLWKPKSKSSEMFRNFVAGFVSGTIATTFNTPLDVIKSRLQNVKGGQIPWAIPTLMNLYREEGFKACYKGYVPRILRLGPGGGIMLLAFDVVSSWL